MKDLPTLLEISSQGHSHLCPRQILGVRLALCGMHSIGFFEPPAKKRLLVIVETDGCFADGVSAATECTVGHRTMRVEDYGKTAAVFVDILHDLAIRISPVRDIREKACIYAPSESRHYFAQMQAYQLMPDHEMFALQTVKLNTPVDAIVSRPGVRAICSRCGEEIMNEREVMVGGITLCRPCADGGYYSDYDATSRHIFPNTKTVIPAFARMV